MTITLLMSNTNSFYKRVACARSDSFIVYSFRYNKKQINVTIKYGIKFCNCNMRVNTFLECTVSVLVV